MTQLRQRMLEDMQIRNLSKVTQKRYLDRVAAFAKYFRRSPEQLGPEEIRRYQVYLLNDKKLSSSTLNVTVCALRFLYKVTLKRNWDLDRIPHARREKKLPVVLSPEEVVQFLQAVKSMKYRAILVTAYSAGLRVSEVTRLKVRDIDSRRIIIRVDQGKGRKDRYVMLSRRFSIYCGSTGKPISLPIGCFPEEFRIDPHQRQQCEKYVIRHAWYQG